MMKALFFLFSYCFIIQSFAQDPFSKDAARQKALPTSEFNINQNIKGTLKIVESNRPSPLVIFVPDQGVVDRNGNDMRSRHYAYQQLADSLFERGVSSYRYDKRTFTQVKNRRVDNNTLFDDFFMDLKKVIASLADDNRFSKIILLGHGQGSLVSMLALDQDIDGFISIAGSALPIDDVIVEQIKLQQPGLDKVARATFDQVKSQDKVVNDVERDLMSILNPSIQPFMKSWMQYNPEKLAQEINLPVLVLHGSKDRQVNTRQADLLHAAFSNSELKVIDNMNHIFKIVGNDEVVASKSYIDPNFPINKKLINVVTAFAKE